MRSDEFRSAVSGQLRNMRSTLERIASARSSLDEHRIVAIGSYLHDIYGGLGNVLERFLEFLAVPKPTGGDYHQLLLAFFVNPQPPLPQLLPSDVEPFVQELRGFRHIARHRYAVTYDWERMEPHVNNLNSWIERWFSIVNQQLAAVIGGL